MRLGEDFQITGVNDQHAYLRMPADAALAVGDIVMLGVSHPDFEYLIIDSTIIRAHQHAAGAKKGGLTIRPSGALAEA